MCTVASAGAQRAAVGPKSCNLPRSRHCAQESAAERQAPVANMSSQLAPVQPNASQYQSQATESLRARAFSSQSAGATEGGHLQKSGSRVWCKVIVYVILFAVYTVAAMAAQRASAGPLSAHIAALRPESGICAPSASRHHVKPTRASAIHCDALLATKQPSLCAREFTPAMLRERLKVVTFRSQVHVYDSL